MLKNEKSETLNKDVLPEFENEFQEIEINQEFENTEKERQSNLEKYVLYGYTETGDLYYAKCGALTFFDFCTLSDLMLNDLTRSTEDLSVLAKEYKLYFEKSRLHFFSNVEDLEEKAKHNQVKLAGLALLEYFLEELELPKDSLEVVIKRYRDMFNLSDDKIKYKSSKDTETVVKKALGELSDTT